MLRDLLRLIVLLPFMEMVLAAFGEVVWGGGFEVVWVGCALLLCGGVREEGGGGFCVGGWFVARCRGFGAVGVSAGGFEGEVGECWSRR